MKIFYNSARQSGIGGGLAVIPDSGEGGAAIVNLLSSGAAQVLTVEDGEIAGYTCVELKSHIELGHCRINDNGEVYLLDIVDWPENASVEEEGES